MLPEINFYNPRSLILFVCILQGVIFACLLFVRSFRQKKMSDLWLGGLLLVMCSSLITHFIGFANVYDNNQWLTYFPFQIVFAHAPIIYLYVKTLTNEKRGFQNKDLLLFIPAIICWAYFFILFLQTMDFKDWYGDNIQGAYVTPFLDISLFLWNACFLYFSITHYKQYRNWLDENFSDTELIKFNWLRNFLYIFAFLFLLESVFDVVGLFRNISYIQAYYLKLIIALAIYYLAIAGYLRSKTIEIDFSPKKIETDETPKNLLETNELESAKTKLLELMQTEKPYLDSQLTLKELSTNLGVNTSVLSHTINKGFDKNFNDFINEYRIAEFKKALEKDSTNDETFLSIAFDCGFNSKATFNRAFKKFNGISPKEFQEQISAD